MTLYPEATAEYESIAIGCRIGHSNCKSSRAGISTQQKFSVLLKQQTDLQKKYGSTSYQSAGGKNTDYRSKLTHLLELCLDKQRNDCGSLIKGILFLISVLSLAVLILIQARFTFYNPHKNNIMRKEVPLSNPFTAIRKPRQSVVAAVQQCER